MILFLIYDQYPLCIRGNKLGILVKKIKNINSNNEPTSSRCT